MVGGWWEVGGWWWVMGNGGGSLVVSVARVVGLAKSFLCQTHLWLNLVLRCCWVGVVTISSKSKM